jgi:drug/metabolite transporter (DMT)-like permease
MEERLAVLALVLSGIAWGTTWIPLKHFAGLGLRGVEVTFLSYGAVGVATLPLIWRERASWRSQQRLLLVGALAGGAANVCFVSGIMFGEVVRVMLLFYLTPVWAVLGARLLLGERLSYTRASAVGTAVLGAVMILGGPKVLTQPVAPADALGLGAGIFYAAQTVVFRAADRVPVLSKALSVFLACGVLSGWLWALWVRGPLPVAFPVWLELVAFAGAWIGVAMWTTMYGVTHLEAGRAAVLLVFELVVAVVSAVVLGHERLSAVEWSGAALILGASLLEARQS